MPKQTCETQYCLDIRALKQQGLLRNGGSSGLYQWGSDGEITSSIGLWIDTQRLRVRLRYRFIDPCGKECELDYVVSLTTTPCFFGGRRYWFKCPINKDVTKCDRRVAVLYMGDKYFGCRSCYDLTYQSQQKTHTGRWSLFGRIMDLQDEIAKGHDHIRIKHWLGRPTKRFRKWLAMKNRYNQLSPQLRPMVKEMERCLRGEE